MKVSVYQLGEGRQDVMVEASPGNGKAPLVMQRVPRQGFAERVEELIVVQRGRRLDDPTQG